jgi:hypothetical protein
MSDFLGKTGEKFPGGEVPFLPAATRFPISLIEVYKVNVGAEVELLPTELSHTENNKACWLPLSFSLSPYLTIGMTEVLSDLLVRDLQGRLGKRSQLQGCFLY